mmetsp:Transcript_4316/g.10367  ORF Transcript_4316/g.10367 Transcript_4316/m.10367 type:complete len:548 (+) Transcript_4316:31-1674(+)
MPKMLRVVCLLVAAQLIDASGHKSHHQKHKPSLKGAPTSKPFGRTCTLGGMSQMGKLQKIEGNEMMSGLAYLAKDETVVGIEPHGSGNPSIVELTLQGKRVHSWELKGFQGGGKVVGMTHIGHRKVAILRKDSMQIFLVNIPKPKSKVVEITHSPAPNMAITIKMPPVAANQTVAFGGMSYDPKGEFYYIAQNVKAPGVLMTRLLRVAAKTGAASVIWDSKRHEQNLPNVAERVCRTQAGPMNYVERGRKVGETPLQCKQRTITTWKTAGYVQAVGFLPIMSSNGKKQVSGAVIIGSGQGKGFLELGPGGDVRYHRPPTGCGNIVGIGTHHAGTGISALCQGRFLLSLQCKLAVKGGTVGVEDLARLESSAVKWMDAKGGANTTARVTAWLQQNGVNASDVETYIGQTALWLMQLSEKNGGNLSPIDYLKTATVNGMIVDLNTTLAHLLPSGQSATTLAVLDGAILIVGMIILFGCVFCIMCTTLKGTFCLANSCRGITRLKKVASAVIEKTKTGSNSPHIYDQMQDAMAGYDEVEMGKLIPEDRDE